MIWYDDPVQFLMNPINWYTIVPDSEMDLDEQLNAMVIFSIYFAIIIIIVNKDTRVLYVVVLVCFMTYMFHKHKMQENFKSNELNRKLNIEKDEIHNRYCVKPTKDNPFMNVSLNDYDEFPNRPAACKDINEVVDALYKSGAPVNETDPFNVKGGDRQFYTTPSTTIPNDSDSFRSFLFDLKPTLKQMGQNF